MTYLEGTITDFSRLNITDLFEKSVLAHSENIALVFNDDAITYAELNARVNKLANYLVAKGVKHEDLVPLCLNSSIELIIGIIAIQKTGAAYVPVDPEYPTERIYYILNDCAAKFIVTDNDSAPIFNNTSAELIVLDKALTISANLSKENPDIEIAAENLAYVIYTSGTTGVPNGVIITHGSVANNLIWAQKYLNLATTDVALQKTTFCFDVSVWEIMGPLIAGARLVIMPKDDYRDISKLRQIIKTRQITTAHFIPTMLEFFLLSIEQGEFSSLKRVICSGEALTPYQANLFKSKLPGVLLYNLYGPTETTIHSSYWMLPDDDAIVEKVLIGKPIDYTELLILDENGQLLGDDMVGEIHIGGYGVARGYLNKPTLTDKRFIKNPLSDTSEIVFKTGDFGRYLSDGNIEYLGRIDDQVKINGYRIELASIESAIKNSGIVKHAVVLTKKNKLGFLQITAYVVLLPEHTVQDLWDHLVTKLPGYMLPTSIKAVDSIPFTSNGKADREQLINSISKDESAATSVEPTTPYEKTIHEIWKRVLHHDSINIYDNFFELGGNSIMGVQMLSLLKKETDKHISYIQLNQYPNIASLAKLFDRPSLIDIPNILIAIKPEGTKPPLYLINGGGLVYDGFFNLSDGLDADQPVYGFQSNGYNNQGKLFESIEEIATYYVNSILREGANTPYCLAGFSLGGVIAYEMAKQLKALGKEVKLLVTIDGLTRDPSLIKTKYSTITFLRLIAYSFYRLKYGPAKALNYYYGVFKGIQRTIKTRLENKKRGGSAPEKSQERNTDIDFDIFSLHIKAYLKYNLSPYDGNMVVLRAKEKTFYMDDFIYLGWKPYVKQIKSIPVNGNHYSMYDNTNVEGFANKLQNLLNEGF